MPLLSKNRNDNTTTEPAAIGGGRHHNPMNTSNPTGNTFSAGGGPGGMTGGGYGNGFPAGQQGHNMGTGPTGMTGQQGYDGTNTFGQGQYTHGMSGPGYDNTYGGTGTGAGANMTGPNATGIASSNMVDRDGNHPSGGSGLKLSGKIESAVGTMVGSSALKNKGLQKQQEANAAKLQSTELAEAERLEREAMMRRERAVAHGAHPANSQLGAGHVARGDQGNQDIFHQMNENL